MAAGLQSSPDYWSKIAENCNYYNSSMIKSDTRKKLEFCQSKHYKSWNPDYLAEYSRSDKLTIIY